MLCRRLSPEEAHQLVAQLPSLLQSGLEQCLDGPDPNVAITAIEQELGSVLGAVGDAIAKTAPGRGEAKKSHDRPASQT